MTISFVKRNSVSFFQGKKAKVLTEQKNFGGECIPAGTIVTILDKSSEMKSGIHIKSDEGVIIYNTFCESLELVKEENSANLTIKL